MWNLSEWRWVPTTFEDLGLSRVPFPSAFHAWLDSDNFIQVKLLISHTTCLVLPRFLRRQTSTGGCFERCVCVLAKLAGEENLP